MERVTEDNLVEIIASHAAARGGIDNQVTHSESAFVCIGKYCGAYVLSTFNGPMWIGLQSSTARWTDNGRPFASISHALEAILRAPDDPFYCDLAAYYFDDSVLMFRWLADKIESYKSSGDFLISG